MDGMETLGRMLLIMGGLIALLGVIFLLGGKMPWFGRLPGDIRIERGNASCVFPIATSLLLSLVLTIFLNLIARLLRK